MLLGTIAGAVNCTQLLASASSHLTPLSVDKSPEVKIPDPKIPLPETNKDPLVSKPELKIPLPLATMFPVDVAVKLTVVALSRTNEPVPALMLLPVIVAPERLVNCPEIPLITVNKPVLPVMTAPDKRDVNVPDTPVRFAN